MQGLQPHRYLPCSNFGFKRASFVTPPTEAHTDEAGMTDLATSAPDATTAATPARTGSAGSAWLKWLARRLGLAILTLWLCSVLVFFATAALGDPVRAILGKDYASSPERVAALTANSSWTSR